MVDRALAFEDLATWDDVQGMRVVTEDGTNPNETDPRSAPPEIEEIDKRVAEIEEELAQLKVKRNDILARRALIAGVPPEILSRMFELGVHDSIPLLHSISLVSRHWRNIALETPSLWSYIKLDYNWGYSRSAAFQQKMKLYLERSQACKLFVDLDCRYLDLATELSSIMADLSPHLSRCFFFRVSVQDWDWMAIIRMNARELGPNLESLYLRVDPCDSEDQTPHTVLSQPCPRLKTIVLEYTPLISIRTELPALETLHLIRDQRYTTSSSSSRIGISMKDLLEIVETTPTLRELRFQSAAFILDGTDLFRTTPSLAPLPALRNLSFHFLDTINLAVFLDSVSLPALQRLSVQMDCPNDDNLNWLSKLTEDRFPSLRYLDLRGCNLDGVHLVPFIRALHQLPRLIALGISCPPSGTLGAKLFNLLASPGDDWILPRLQALCLQSCRDISGHEILKVVTARNGMVEPDVADIRFLKLAQCFSLDPDVVDVLSGLVEKVAIL
ncbi:hypothetical protein JAAARDRAFT_176490 [Jaapia argillacea MUCL 33604]|uniref:Uncharacterized protein n=1 Tax=Jaapia argillacea MUCL 33604 TaxID=933084 RepID=A0A067PUL6_9AGAM|nr:hypothetical protein JAAARDRAFT_176490 [Jaapia argillacea MUCL 33604]